MDMVLWIEQLQLDDDKESNKDLVILLWLYEEAEVTAEWRRWWFVRQLNMLVQKCMQWCIWNILG